MRTMAIRFSLSAAWTTGRNMCWLALFLHRRGRDDRGERRMTEHPIYGEQMAVESYELKAPEDTVSMERYLGSRRHQRRRGCFSFQDC